MINIFHIDCGILLKQPAALQSVPKRAAVWSVLGIALMYSLCRYGVLLQVQATAYCSSS